MRVTNLCPLWDYLSSISLRLMWYVLLHTFCGAYKWQCMPGPNSRIRYELMIEILLKLFCPNFDFNQAVILHMTMMMSSNGNIFPRYWPFVREIHRPPVNSPPRGQWRGAFMFPLIFAWINGWENNREADDLSHHRAHYDVTVMQWHDTWASAACTRICLHPLKFAK